MKVAFLFLPPWDPKYPSYAMALFKASTKEHGHDFIGFDLNVDLFNAAQDHDKKLWDAQHANLWEVDRDNIIQKYAYYLDAYTEEIITNQADLYAISIIYYSRFLAFYIAQRIKKLIPKASILVGGPQCFPAYSGLNILENRNIDAICAGEGDIIWPNVLRHFDKNRNLQINIPGLSYKKDDGTIIDNGVPELVKDLNSVPLPDYSDIDFAKYGHKYHLSIMTSRGCINTCAFCSERPNFRKYRYRSAENIFNEISKHLGDLNTYFSINRDKIAISYKQNILTKIAKQYYHQLKFRCSGKLFKKTARYFYHKYKETTFGKILGRAGDLLGPVTIDPINGIVPYISFNDSLINGAPSELDKFCDLVIENNLKFSWGGMALIRKEMTYDLFVKMKKAGCYNLAWGMESGCQEVLNLMHKRFFNMDLAKEVIKAAFKADISQTIALIVGFPGETEEMLLETKAFLAEYKDFFAAVSVQPMMVVKNSLVYDKPELFGVNRGDDGLRWETTDGMNNYDVRLKRVEIIKSVLDGNVITIDK